MYDTKSLQVYSRLHCDIEDIARSIEYDCADVLLPAPKGIYVANKVEPVMVDGKEYYILDEGTGNKTVINNLGVLKCKVYHEGKVVIPAKFMQNKQKYLSNEPILPYRGIKAVECLVRDLIACFVAYEDNVYRNETIYQQFLNPALVETDELVSQVDPWICNINNAFYETSKDILDFMGVHKWHLYFIKIIGTQLIIEKSIDYRAWLWLDEQAKIKQQNELLDQ